MQSQKQNKCIVCNRVQELRFGACFDCANFESLIHEKRDMYENPVVKKINGSESLNILKMILDFYNKETKNDG